MLSRVLAGRSLLHGSSKRHFSDVVVRPIRRTVSPKERDALRQARKEQAAKVLQQQSAKVTTTKAVQLSSRWVWYISVGVPSALLVWGFNDETSPPAQFSEMIGLTSLIQSFSEDFAKPSHDKLLPDWSQVCE